jgi:diadenosine tetraphosphate (Ap4A) HIT family hydrolase
MIERNARPATGGTTCLFCRVDDESVNNIMVQSENFYVRYDNFPATDGHVEIVPKRHVESFFDLTSAEVGEAYGLMRQVRQRLRDNYRAEGYTIAVNDGRAAGRTVDHLHIHIVPRRTGDVPDPRGGFRRALPNFDPDRWYAVD